MRRTSRSSKKKNVNSQTPTRAAPTRRSALTPLARVLQELKGRRQGRATALDAFELARKKWLRGERLDISQLAQELGVARTTVFRWVGTREQLYGEVLKQAYEQLREHILSTTNGSGLDRLVQVVRRNLTTMFRAPAMRRFIEQDPEFAIRMLTSKSSTVQARIIELEVEFLREVIRSGNLKPMLDVDTLAYVIVRIGEAFLYADVISGRSPEIEKAVAAIRILVAAEAPQRTARRAGDARRSRPGPAPARIRAGVVPRNQRRKAR